MSKIVFPASWGSLKHPHVRWELLAELAELADPSQTSRWLAPDPDGPIIGIDMTIHFFFDDHDFDPGEVGYSLFDESEVHAVNAVVAAIDAVIGLGKKPTDNERALSHPGWPKVERAARTALEQLRTRGIPTFEKTNS